MRRSLGRGALAVVVAVLATPGAAGAKGLGVDWESLLPAFPSSSAVQPGSVPYCETPTLACVDTEIERMEAAQASFGCDHRGVFATTYLELTRQLREDRGTHPDRYADPRYLYSEDALFADIYFETLDDWASGRPVPAAWRIALQTARAGQVNAAQDMLLGINAHVQNDMPFVLAALGQRRPDGTTRKPDHDAFNPVLDDAYQRVVDAIERRYDPLVGGVNSKLTPLDDVGGLEMVRGWRELVWRNAERLLAAKDAAARQRVADQIEANAAAWATLIATQAQPGYRATRDAYCASAGR